MTTADIDTLAIELGDQLLKRSLKVASAESCTGGWIAQAITSVAGSSQWFELGLVTYSNVAKQQQLGVSASILDEYGAVSKPVVEEMVKGAIQQSKADIAVAVSGIAGPDGGTEDKPVGTVWIAWATKEGEVSTRLCNFKGDRAEVRRQTVAEAFTGLLRILP